MKKQRFGGLSLVDLFRENITALNVKLALSDDSGCLVYLVCVLMFSSGGSQHIVSGGEI